LLNRFLLTLIVLALASIWSGFSIKQNPDLNLAAAKVDTISKQTARAKKVRARTVGNLIGDIRYYSKNRNMVGLRQTFDDLSRAYQSQRKYSQAKWFILQSNTLSREYKDTINIINSLLKLSTIKIAIKDYDLAEADMHDAINLATLRRDDNLRLQAQQLLKNLYVKTGNSKKALAITHHIKAEQDSLNNIKTIVRQNEAIKPAKPFPEHNRVKPILRKNTDQYNQPAFVAGLAILIIALIGKLISLIILFKRNKR
jgi:preprotein translocase subunit Sss1